MSAGFIIIIIAYSVAVCSQPCLNGDCIAPDVCGCVSGWTRVSCVERK